MRIRIRPAVIGLALLLGTAPAVGGPVQPDTLDELMVASGLTVQIGHLASALNAGLEPAGGLMPADILKAIQTAIARAYRTELVDQEVRDYLLAHLAQEDATGALSWLRSPLGKRITRLEEAGSGLEAQRAIAALTGTLKDTDAERVQLGRRLDSLINATEHATRFAIYSSLAMSLGLMAARPTDGGPSVDDVLDEIQALRPQIEAQMADAFVTSFIYVYRDLSDEEIGRYIAFAESPAGSAYQKHASDALSEAMLLASRRLAQILPEVLLDRNKEIGS